MEKPHTENLDPYQALTDALWEERWAIDEATKDTKEYLANLEDKGQAIRETEIPPFNPEPAPNLDPNPREGRSTEDSLKRDAERRAAIDQIAEESKAKRARIEWEISGKLSYLDIARGELERLQSDRKHWTNSKRLATFEEPPKASWEIYECHKFFFEELPSPNSYAQISVAEKQKTIQTMEDLAHNKIKELDEKVGRLEEVVRSDQQICTEELEDEDLIELYSVPTADRNEWLRNYEKKLETLSPCQRLKLKARMSLNALMEPLPVRFRSIDEYAEFSATISDLGVPRKLFGNGQFDFRTQDAWTQEPRDMSARNPLR